MPLFKKPKDPEAQIKTLVKELTRLKFKLEFKVSDVEADIKKAYRANKKPSVGQLHYWKSLKNFESFIENQIAGFDNQLLFVEFGNGLKTALGVDNISQVQKALDKLNLKMAGIEDLIDRCGNMQLDMAANVTDFNAQLEQQSVQMETLLQPLTQDAEQELNAEFLADIQLSDPDFFKSIPEDLRNL